MGSPRTDLWRSLFSEGAHLHDQHGRHTRCLRILYQQKTHVQTERDKVEKAVAGLPTFYRQDIGE